MIITKKKPNLITVDDILDYNDEMDISDPGSLELGSDCESFTEEEVFYSTTHRPVCSVCSHAIEEFIDLKHCKECKKDTHNVCCENSVCNTCLSK